MTALLFDLDGTLADTVPVIVRSSRLALRELGREDITDAQIRALIGVPLYETGEILFGPGQGDAYRACYHKHFQTIGYSGLRSFAGLPELLAELAAGGARLACVTSKRQQPAEQTLEECDLRQLFPVLVTAESCEKHKPDPEPAHQALRLLGVDAGEPAVFIGDSHFDIDCGRNAGLLTCGVTWGAGSEEELAQADHLARSVAELGALLWGLLA